MFHAVLLWRLLSDDRKCETRCLSKASTRQCELRVLWSLRSVGHVCTGPLFGPDQTACHVLSSRLLDVRLNEGSRCLNMKPPLTSLNVLFLTQSRLFELKKPESRRSGTICGSSPSYLYLCPLVQ